MVLTVSKRVEFSASRRLFARGLSAAANQQRYGAESESHYGSGRNYVAYFIFSGEPDPITGMLINISEIKLRAGEVIADRYDHRFLNEDNPAFREQVPTPENIARQLLHEVEPLFRGDRARLAAVHLRESPTRTATAYAQGAVDANFWWEFSAARRTLSPHLTDAENEQLFGEATGDHGHNYRVRLTFDAQSERDDIDSLIEQLRRTLDHKHLNRDVAALQDQPITTESLARFVLREMATRSAVTRVRLHERDNFFAEAWRGGEMFVGLRESFGAAHRLHVPQFSESENTELFGKCNNPKGHGHHYVIEPTVAAAYDERSGAAIDFAATRKALDEVLESWRDKHLDAEMKEFRERTSTGENIVRALWSQLEGRVSHPLHRLRLWETANNRFTLRR
ncbi:MAG: 6-carboxytetrahydropterin synthase [Verrucomicrobiota bacterium]